MQINKKLLRNQIAQETGKVVLLKDLSNIASSSSERCDIKSCVEDLKDLYGKFETWVIAGSNPASLETVPLFKE